jgi:large subunit ribosomal protein L28
VFWFEGTIVMSKMCSICGKKPSTGCNVSHSQRHTKRRWLPNLQQVHVKTEGGNRHVKVCTSCIKAGKVQKAG